MQFNRILTESRRAAVGQRIGALVFSMAGMAFHLSPHHMVRRYLLIQLGP